MNSYYVLWGAIVILAGAIVHSAGIISGAIAGNLNYGAGSCIFGAVLMMIGGFGPGLGRLAKRAYDAVPVDDKPKGTP
jgi:hypothetical protein